MINERNSPFERHLKELYTFRRRFTIYTYIVNLLAFIPLSLSFIYPNSQAIKAILGCTLLLFLSFFYIKFRERRTFELLFSKPFKIRLAHVPASDSFISFKIGEELTVGKCHKVYSEFYFCENDSGSGYVHNSAFSYNLDDQLYYGVKNYSSREIAVNTSDLVNVLDYADQWVLVSKGEESGWILAACISMI